MKVAAYHRPGTLEEALALLPAPSAVVLAGGTALNASSQRDPVEVVDLQALGLDAVEVLGGGRLRLGAMVTLQQLADDGRVPAVLRDLARREVPSTLRSLATVGGCVAVGDWESELLAGLLVHEAAVTVIGPDGAADLALGDVLAHRDTLAGRIVTAVTVAAGGETAAARTGRTPADRPIVAAVARRSAGGAVLVAVTGVAATPVMVEPGTVLHPPGDFRGSAEYRTALAATLVERVRAGVA